MNEQASRALSVGKPRKITLNSCFKAANECKLRYRVLYGGAGSGKSMNVARDYILKLSDPKYKGANLLCVRKSENSNATSTFAELCKAIKDIFGRGYSKIWEIKSAPCRLRCKVTGNKIVFRGCNDLNQIEKIKSITFSSGNLTWIWVEEATELLQSDIEILDDRMRGQFDNPNLYHQMTLTFNPVSARHWIKRVFVDVPSDDVFLHHSTYLDNKFIDAEYHKRMLRRKESDFEGYRIYGLGEWGEMSGLIFKNVAIADVAQEFSHYDDVAYGQDFGFNHANALLALGIKDGNVYILKEIYVTEKDSSEVIKLAADWDKSRLMFCDSAEPDRIQMWSRAGFRASGALKGAGSVKAQIDWLLQRKIYVDRGCVNTINEITQYRWEKDRLTGEYTDEPANFNDDAMAALRYGVQLWRLRDSVGKLRRGEVKYHFKSLEPKRETDVSVI
ncbi:MAG: PBSX family phage terminase large subunit [Oscillospiraceae bacterium]|nr:PBSX family phage terminase large subunit [Oscillospiraceae bacterium]